MNACMYACENAAAVGGGQPESINETESAWVLALKMAYHMGSLDVACWTESVPIVCFKEILLD